MRLRWSGRVRWTVLLLLAFLLAAGGGAALKSALGQGQAQAQPSIAAIAPPPGGIKPPPLEGDPVVTLLRSATVLAPHSYHNLTLFPVTVSAVADFGAALTLDEALSRGLLIVEEVGLGAVNQVLAANRADRHVFVMAGEMIGGAKQDRTAGEDALLAPRSKVRLPVYCVEAARWSAAPSGARFHALAHSAPPSVRRAAAEGQDQSQVWSQVEREQRRLEAPSSTGALRSVYESADVQRRLAPYESNLAGVPKAAPNVVGVVVARGGRIVCADLFYRPDLFRRLWPKLLRSYAADALGPPEMGGVTVREAEQFLGRVYHAARRSVPTAGVGSALRLHGAGVSGSALIFRRSVVHLEVFPGIEYLPQPLPAPRMDLDYRRQRLERE